MNKKKKVEEMTEDGATKEFKRLLAKLEKLQPELESELSDIVGEF